MPYGSDAMTVAEQLGVLAPSDMLRIVKDGKDVWVGYLDNLHPHTGTADCNTYELIQHEEVKRTAWASQTARCILRKSQRRQVNNGSR